MLWVVAWTQCTSVYCIRDRLTSVSTLLFVRSCCVSNAKRMPVDLYISGKQERWKLNTAYTSMTNENAIQLQTAVSHALCWLNIIVHWLNFTDVCPKSAQSATIHFTQDNSLVPHKQHSISPTNYAAMYWRVLCGTRPGRINLNNAVTSKTKCQTGINHYFNGRLQSYSIW